MDLGMRFAVRYLKAHAAGRGDMGAAASYAASQRWIESSRIETQLKGDVPGMTVRRKVIRAWGARSKENT